MSAFDYSSRDYETIKRDLLARADRVFPEWTDRDPSDFGMMLLDLWAYSSDVLHYYVDRAAGEAFLSTATQRESVLALANLLDYTPRGRTSATGTVLIENTTLSPIVIPAYTEFIARYDDTTYHVYTAQATTIPASSSTNVIVTEGKLTLDEVLTSGGSGISGQRYTLTSAGVAIRSVVVDVLEDGVTPTDYQHVARLTSADTGDRVFSTDVSADGFVDIMFGSSLNGFVPPPGATITATYASSSGSSGNLPANSISSFKGVTPTGIVITSSTALSGGTDEESIASLKVTIPTAISAQNRAVTRSDFIALATQVDGVAKATLAFSPSLTGASAGSASVTMYTQPVRSDFLTTTDTFQTVSAEMRADTIASIQPRALLGVEVLAAPTITWNPIDIVVTINVTDRFVSNWVKRDVSSALDELFDFDNVFFGQRISIGQVYRIILNVPGVDYATITKFDVSGGVTVQDSILTGELGLPKKGIFTFNMVGGITTS